MDEFQKKYFRTPAAQYLCLPGAEKVLINFN